MNDLADLGAARAALNDPATSGEALRSIAQLHPGLRAQVAVHPAAYPGLLDWLGALNDPALNAVLNLRRGAAKAPASPSAARPTPSAQAQPTQPLPTQPFPGQSQPAQPTQAQQLQAQQLQAQQLQAQQLQAQQLQAQQLQAQQLQAQQLQAQQPRPEPSSAPLPPDQRPFPQPLSAQPGFEPPSDPPQPVVAPPQPAKRPPKKLLIGLGAGAMALVLIVTGFLTNGFGLLPSGGSATPEEEAIKVADKTAGLVNSLSLSDLLNNPYSAANSLTREFAPSEARLYSSFTTVDTTDLLGLTDNFISLAAELAGSFKVEVDGLKADANELSDDIALVRYVGGTVTVTADVARLREVLPKLPAAAAEQVTATAEKYGLHPYSIPVGRASEDWAADLLNEIERQFPVTVDVAEYDAAARSGESLPDYTIGDIYKKLSAVMVVREGGRWYLSPLLTSQIWSNWWSFSYDAEPLDSETRSLLELEGANNSSPVAAAEALTEAHARGEPREILRQLPLSERRYIALGGTAWPFGSSGGEADISYRFSEIARTGSQAKVRIDELVLFDGTEGIRDGTCLVSGGRTMCLRDYLNSNAVADMANTMRQLYWGTFENSTGIAPDDLIDRLEVAARAAVETIDPDQIGLVAVEENGSWQISRVATISDLQNQAVNALVVGLKAAQQR